MIVGPHTWHIIIIIQNSKDLNTVWYELLDDKQEFENSYALHIRLFFMLQRWQPFKWKCFDKPWHSCLSWFIIQAVKEHFGQNGRAITVLLPKLQNTQVKLLYWNIHQLSYISHKEVNLNVNLGATSKFAAPASITLSSSNYPSSFVKNWCCNEIRNTVPSTLQASFQSRITPPKKQSRSIVLRSPSQGRSFWLQLA